MDFEFPTVGHIQMAAIQNYKFYLNNDEDVNFYIDLQMT